jgi:hypothetical protein
MNAMFLKGSIVSWVVGLSLGIRYSAAAAPFWFLDGENHVRSIDLPPMAEKIVIIENQLAVLFESGAKKFKRFGKSPLDHIILLKLEELNP